jgi:plastocyanin
MTRMKLLLTTTLALIVGSVSLVAVAQSAGAAQTVRVIEQSYSIRLSAKPKPGVVKFVVRNASDDGHDFWLRGGGKTWKTRVLGEARTASLTATLKKGVKYTYWCAVGSHRSKGMSGSFVAR